MTNTEKRTKKTPAKCRGCQQLHDFVVEQDQGRPEAERIGAPRVTTAKWRITYRDGVRFQQQMDLCAKHFTDVLNRLTPKGQAVDLTLTKLR